MTRNRLALTLGILLGLAFATSCTTPTQPVTHCTPQVIQTPHGPWTTGEQQCESLNPRTGQGHAVRP